MELQGIFQIESDGRWLYLARETITTDVDATLAMMKRAARDFGAPVRCRVEDWDGGRPAYRLISPDGSFVDAERIGDLPD